MLQLLALIAVIFMALILYNDCDPASSFIFAISVFITFLWLTPRLDSLANHGLAVTLRYLAIYLIILSLLVLYITGFGISRPRGFCKFKG
jgi:hypothetical protein